MSILRIRSESTALENISGRATSRGAKWLLCFCGPTPVKFGVLHAQLFLAVNKFCQTDGVRAQTAGQDSNGRDHLIDQLLSSEDHVQHFADLFDVLLMGRTDELGFEVSENAVDNRRLFATIFRALGIDPHEEYELPGLPTFHRVEEQAEPINEILIERI